MNDSKHALPFFFAALTLGTSAAYGQPPAKPGGYPTKPVKVIVGFAAGGGADFMTRVVAQKLSERIGQQFIVENRMGAAGNLAAEAVARSPNDGYVLLMGAIASHAGAMSYYAKLNYDIRTDFAPISLLGTAPLVLIVHPSLPVKNVKELIALAKSRPGALNFPSTGMGGIMHLTSEMFKQMAKIDIVHIPYKGTGLFMLDFLSGQLAMAIDVPPAHLQYFKVGRLRPLAVTTMKRTAILPDLPTLAEAGLPGFESMGSYSLLAPLGASKDIVAYLNRETRALLELADVREKMMISGMEPGSSTPEGLDAFIKAEVIKWAKVIKAAGITPE